MTSRPTVEQSNGTLPARTHGRLLPSALPPPASSSLTSLRPPSGASAVSSQHSEKHPGDQLDGAGMRTSHSQSVSSNQNTVASSKDTSKGSLSAENRERQRAVRTLPPWVQSVEEDDNADPTSLLLPRTPTHVRPASHHYMPTPKSNVPGRHFDHAREGTPVAITKTVREQASQWQNLVKANNFEHRPPSSRGQIVDDEWMKEHLADLEAPWVPIDKDEEDVEDGFWLLNSKSRARKMKRVHRTIMNHPMVPLVVRLTVLTFSALALGLAGSIYHKSDNQGCQNNSSTYLAVIVDVVAIIYTTYITYDEYTSKPLGLRSHVAKMTLIFMDLLFIVFDSANLSLAFQALTDQRWACRSANDPAAESCPYVGAICVRQKALTGTLLVALIAWLMTFAISTLRLIERVMR